MAEVLIVMAVLVTGLAVCAWCADRVPDSWVDRFERLLAR